MHNFFIKYHYSFNFSIGLFAIQNGLCQKWSILVSTALLYEILTNHSVILFIQNIFEFVNSIKGDLC